MELVTTSTSAPIALDVFGVMRELSVGKTTAYNLLASGELPSFQIGRRRLVAHEDLVAFVERKRGERDAS